MSPLDPAIPKNNNLTSTPSRPTATAIAVPLSICGLIGVVAMIILARKRRNGDGKKGGDVEGGGGGGMMDWEKVVKAKAEAGRGVLVEKQGGGDESGSRVGVGVVPSLGYGGVSDREKGRRRDREDDRDRRRSIRDEDRYDRKRRDRDDYRDRHCGDDYRQYRRESYLRDRDDRFTHLPAYERPRERCSSNHSHSRSHSKSNSHSNSNLSRTSLPDYYSTSRRSTSSLGGIGSSCTCSHEPEPWGRSRSKGGESLYPAESIYNPHPHTPTVNRSRPLPLPLPLTRPQPIVRTESYESDSATGTGTGTGKKMNNPTLSGGLRRSHSQASTVTHSGWELAGEGRLGQDGERGMEGLYESLRRAIGTPRM